MTTYTGTMVNGLALVSVDGKPLDPRYDLRNHSPTGFAWGYEGSAPAQLSLAILADHYGNDEQALEVYQTFKSAVVACLAGGNPWILTTIEIIEALDELDLGR